MPNGPSVHNGNGGGLTRKQLDALVVWGFRGLLGLLMAIMLWIGNGLLGRLEIAEANNIALRDRVLKLETQHENDVRRIVDNEQQVENIRTLIQTGQVRVLPPQEVQR